jgi:DNA polymerase III subunit beta
MKFVVSSTELLNHLQIVGRVINTKNTLPILDNLLFQLEDKDLIITASDLESTMITRIPLENVSGEGSIAIPARILTDSLKEFSEQPLTFDINAETLAIEINSENGKFTAVGQKGSDYPQIPVVRADKKSSVRLKGDALLSGISKTIFATADDELRPVMNGIFIELHTDHLTFVASDAHKLVRYKRTDVSSETESSFILPKKPAGLLKNILSKGKEDVNLEFDDKNAFFSMTNYKVICRLVEGNYPNYAAVIPAKNPNKLIVDRVDFYNSLRRVAVFSNPASNLVKLQLAPNQVTVSAQDIDFSVSGYEKVKCQYDGDPMEIGFKSVFLIEILANLSSQEVQIELSDPSRAGILIPAEKENEEEDILMLLMPMMINV